MKLKVAVRHCERSEAISFKPATDCFRLRLRNDGNVSPRNDALQLSTLHSPLSTLHSPLSTLNSIVLFALLTVSLLAGCDGGKRTQTGGDAHARENRLIVTNSDALEMLIGLGAAKNVVGINDLSTAAIGSENPKWPSVGNWQNPNIEAIVNLKPDIAVSYHRWPDPAVFDDKLKPFNIPVERINCYYMSEYHSDLYRLAAMVGKEEMADTIAHDFDGIVNTIRNAVADIDVKKKIYFESYSDFSAMGAGSGVNEIIELVNATNIAAKFNILYPKVSTEWLLEENPDVIIKVVSAETITVDMYERLISRAGWDKLKAVKSRQVYLITSKLASGPRAMIGGLYIGKWCYPERFASVNPDSVHAGWLKKYYGVTSCNKSDYSFKPELP